MSESMKTTLNELCQKDIATASDAELYTALLRLVQEQSQKQIKPVTGRKLYYISAEFPDWKIAFQQPNQPWSV